MPAAATSTRLNAAGNGQVKCAYSADVNRDGTSGIPGSTSLEGTNFHGQRPAGVSRGTTGFEFHTYVSKRVKYVEPYAGFVTLFEFQNSSSDYGATDLQGSLVNHPPFQGTLIGGVAVTPWEVRDAFQRVELEFRAKGTYRSEGRDYSPLFDALGSSDAPSKCAVRTSQRSAPAGPGGYPSVVNTSSDKVYVTGITDVQQHGIYTLSGAVTFQAGEYVKFNLGGAFTAEEGHIITFDQPCNPDFKNDPATAGPCKSAGTRRRPAAPPNAGVTGIPNPNYRAVIDAPGRRFRADGDAVGRLGKCRRDVLSRRGGSRRAEPLPRPPNRRNCGRGQMTSSDSRGWPPMRSLATALALALALALTSGAAHAKGDERRRVAVSHAGRGLRSVCPSLHRPSPRCGTAAVRFSDASSTISSSKPHKIWELTVDLPARAGTSVEPPSEATLVQQAGSSWVFSPRLALEGSRLNVRIVAVAPSRERAARAHRRDEADGDRGPCGPHDAGSRPRSGHACTGCRAASGSKRARHRSPCPVERACRAGAECGRPRRLHRILAGARRGFR